MVPPRVSGPLGAADQQLPHRLCSGKIYKGNLKKLCVPGMNCYSCPGAVGSCPIGSLQAVIGSWNFKFAFYVAGFLVFVGALVGRFVCGWLCPFGLIQDLLHKIPFPKKLRTFQGRQAAAQAEVCDSGGFRHSAAHVSGGCDGSGRTVFLQADLSGRDAGGRHPLALMNKSMHSVLGWLYAWKNVLLVATILLSIIIYRPFCKYICPLGAIYSVFNPISVFKYRVDESKCVSCGACSKSCKMGVDPVQNANHPECIRCGLCKRSVPPARSPLAA